MGNDGHVPNVLRVVHEITDLAAQLVPILCLANIVAGCVRCVRGTYLLDREAGRRLAWCPINSSGEQRGPLHQEIARECGRDLLDHDGGVADCSLLRKFSGGGSGRIPRTQAWIRWIERGVELLSLAVQSTRGRRKVRG